MDTGQSNGCEAITTHQPLPLSSLLIISGFWGSVKVTCFLLPAVPHWLLLASSETIKTVWWDW